MAASSRISRDVSRAPTAVGAALALLLLAACATAPPADDPEALAAFQEANDPLEPMNRYFFSINDAFDETLGKAFAGWYYIALPNFAQDGVRNAVRNLRSPIVLANDLFQGEGRRAGITFARFLVNSTLGLAGLFDVASKMGLEYHQEDFGQTLAVAGIQEGPYIVLPLLGPSNPRDLTGRIVDTFLNPLTYITAATDTGFVSVGVSGLELIDFRARNLTSLDEIKKNSLDYYATIRSLYRQSRNDEINNGAPPMEDPYLDDLGAKDPYAEELDDEVSDDESGTETSGLPPEAGTVTLGFLRAPAETN